MMKVVKPEIEEVTEKFKGQENAMKRQQAIMEVYFHFSMLNCAVKIQKSFEMQEHVINIPKKAHP